MSTKQEKLPALPYYGRFWGADGYFVHGVKVPKELYDKYAANESYEQDRKGGYFSDDVVANGLQAVRNLRQLDKIAGRSHPAAKYAQGADFYDVLVAEAAVMKSKSSGPSKSKSSKMPSLQKGRNSRGVTYYKVDGKFASKKQYCAAGGRANECKAAPKKAKAEKKEKKPKSGYYSKKGKDGVKRYFKDGKFVSKAEYDSHKKK